MPPKAKHRNSIAEPRDWDGRLAVGEDLWRPNVELLEATLWHEFRGLRFEWTTTGKATFNASAAAAADAALDEAGFRREKEPEPAHYRYLPQELLEFLTNDLDVLHGEVLKFVADIGFSVPVLQTIKSCAMAVFSGYKAYKHNQDRKDVIREVLATEKRNSPDIGLFTMGRDSLRLRSTAEAKHQLVQLGGYTFDLATSVGAPGLGGGTAVARLVYNVQRLYVTWQTTQRVNDALALENNPGMRELIVQNPLLGCHVFRMDPDVLTGRWSDVQVGEFNPRQKREILGLLGVTEQMEQAERDAVAALANKAIKLTKDAPYKLTNKIRLPRTMPDDGEDAQSPIEYKRDPARMKLPPWLSDDLDDNGSDANQIESI